MIREHKKYIPMIKRDFMVNQIWIIEKQSGICIFNKKFSENSPDLNPDIVSGLFTAMNVILSQSFSGDLQEIILSNQKLYFKFTEELLFIIHLNKRTLMSDYKIKKIFRKIIDEFYAKFNHKMKQIDWFTRISDYECFELELDDILESKLMIDSFLGQL